MVLNAHSDLNYSRATARSMGNILSHGICMLDHSLNMPVITELEISFEPVM